MDLSQIKYFTTLAAELNFTRAAAACNISQPSLTKAIQKLEAELGGPLFFRERSRTQLTELGRLVQPSLERALGAAHEAKQQAESFGDRGSSPLRIGLEQSISASILMPVIAEIRRHCEQIELSLVQRPQADICQRMLDGGLDIALLLVRDDLPERMHRWRLFSESYVVICKDDHRFGQQAAVPVQSLAEENMLFVADANCPVSDLLKSQRVEPRGRYFLDNQEQVVGMVSAGFGIAVIGDRVGISEDIMRRPLAPAPEQRTVVLASLAGRPLGPTPGLFAKLMRARSWVDSDAPRKGIAA